MDILRTSFLLLLIVLATGSLATGLPLLRDPERVRLRRVGRLWAGFGRMRPDRIRSDTQARVEGWGALVCGVVLWYAVLATFGVLPRPQTVIRGVPVTPRTTTAAQATPMPPAVPLPR